jgi:hypothetical protein
VGLSSPDTDNQIASRGAKGFPYPLYLLFAAFSVKSFVVNRTIRALNAAADEVFDALSARGAYQDKKLFAQFFRVKAQLAKRSLPLNVTAGACYNIRHTIFFSFKIN